MKNAVVNSNRLRKNCCVTKYQKLYSMLSVFCNLTEICTIAALCYSDKLYLLALFKGKCGIPD